MPKYIRITKGNLLRYQRDYPTRLQRIADKKTFTYPLGLKKDANEAAVNRAIADANEQYDLHVKMLTESDPAAFAESELDKAAIALLKTRRLRAGQYSIPFDADEDGSPITEEEKTRRHRLFDEAGVRPEEYMNEFDYAEGAFPEIDNVRVKEATGESLTFEDLAVYRAFDKLLSAEKAKPKTLGALWEEYRDHTGINPSTRTGRREERRWQNFLAITGDKIIAPNTNNILHQGLDNYVIERKTSGVKGQTIDRELNRILACLRWVSRKYRFEWQIVRPLTWKDPVASKAVMTREEQRQLFAFGLEQQDELTQLRSAATICMLQGGIMTSELARSEPDDLHLDAEIPYLLIRQKTKTKQRNRVVPIVLAPSFLVDCLPDCIARFKTISDSSRSHDTNVILKKATGNLSLTGHCLRHTFRANAESNGANLMSADQPPMLAADIRLAP
ncbi:MAG: hypothetical protein P8J55_11115, partial [Pseudomonadales bacterium]|nr:hypothetical protein [Pseudomonadales bacterium]